MHLIHFQPDRPIRASWIFSLPRLVGRREGPDLAGGRQRLTVVGAALPAGEGRQFVPPETFGDVTFTNGLIAPGTVKWHVGFEEVDVEHPRLSAVLQDEAGRTAREERRLAVLKRKPYGKAARELLVWPGFVAVTEKELMIAAPLVLGASR